MNRSIKFKLKNGKEVTIRPLRADDYDAFAKFNKDFANGPSAKMNFEYPGAPIESKEQLVKAWICTNSQIDGWASIFCAKCDNGYQHIGKIYI